MKVATPKPEANPKQSTMGTTRASPAELFDVADDGDDDISLIYATPTSRNAGNNRKNAISVEQYADDRDLQLAIMASLRPQTRRKRRIIDLSLFPDADDDVQVLESSSSSSIFKNSFKNPSIPEVGQSSNSKFQPTTFICEICIDSRPHSELFHIMGCSHFYCSDCMIKYVASKLQENIPQIRCPVSDCKGLLEPEHCRSILPPEVFDRWGNALCEAVILAAEKFYCPFKDCSALLIDDGDGGRGRGAITQSECPICRRLFCAQCKVPWHSEIGCSEFEKLNENERGREDIMLMQLAKKNKWMKCPKCKFYIEKSAGCLLMVCRCRHKFCYSCGTTLKDHYCPICRR